MTKHWYKPWTWNYPRAYGALLALIAFSMVVYVIADRQSRNRLAIEKGCILLNNAIIRSSTASSNPRSPSTILVREILTEAVQNNRGYVVKEFQAATRRGPLVIPLIDCKKVADDPGNIKAIPLHAPVHPIVRPARIPPRKR